MIGEFAFDYKSTNVTGELVVVRQLSRDMEKMEGVRRIFSMADAVPASTPEMMASKMMTAMAEEETPSSPLGKMVSSDGLRFILFPNEFTAKNIATWQDFVKSNDKVHVITGMPIVWGEVGQMVLDAQLQSLVAAFALVFIMLIAVYRSLRLTLVSLIPLALTVSLTLGFISASGIMLNLITAIVSSIIIGVGIDYSIHFIAAINYARDGLEGVQQGYVLIALEKVGRPIIANSLGIAIALSALWVSPLKTHGEISMIMWVSMVPAAVLTLLVVPALMPSKGLSTNQINRDDSGKVDAEGSVELTSTQIMSWGDDGETGTLRVKL